MPTFTHTGRREQVGRRNRGKLYGHDIPKAGRVHALNAGGFMGFTALCGAGVSRAREFTEFGDPVPEGERTVQSGADASRVTCAQCRRILRVKAEL